MRLSTLNLLAAACLLGACEGTRLTGPAAQRAFSNAAVTIREVPDDVVIFLNDARLAPGRTLDGLDPTTITSVEILKVTDAKAGVIRITTTNSSLAAELTRPQ